MYHEYIIRSRAELFWGFFVVQGLVILVHALIPETFPRAASCHLQRVGFLGSVKFCKTSSGVFLGKKQVLAV